MKLAILHIITFTMSVSSALAQEIVVFPSDGIGNTGPVLPWGANNERVPFLLDGENPLLVQPNADQGYSTVTDRPYWEMVAPAMQAQQDGFVRMDAASYLEGQVLASDGSVFAAPRYDPQTQVFTGENGLPVDMAHLFSNQEATLPYLSSDEQAQFMQLLALQGNLSAEQAARLGNLYNKGTSYPILKRPYRPQIKVLPNTIIAIITCENGKILPAECEWYFNPDIIEICKCE